MADDLALFLDDPHVAESVTVDGIIVRGIFSIADEVVLDEVVTTAPTLLCSATVAAQSGTACRVRGITYRVRQVLDQPPDGALRQLVLAKVS